MGHKLKFGKVLNKVEHSIEHVESMKTVENKIINNNNVQLVNKIKTIVPVKIVQNNTVQLENNKIF